MIIMIGRYQNGGQMFYRLLNCNLKDIKQAFYRDFTKNQIESALKGGMKIQGVELVQGEVKGINGSLERFDMRKKNNERPVVILQEYVDRSGNTHGYLFANFEGMIKPFRNKQAINVAYVTGIQNGKLVSKDKNNPSAGVFISAIQGTYPKVVLSASDKPVPVQPVKPELKRSPKETNNGKEIFTPAQKAVILKGKEANVNVSIYAHPEYSPEQMEQILKGLMDKIMVKYYAKPEFSVECMEKIRLEMSNKFEVRPYANPMYNIRQMEQIRLGMESGVNYSKYANPNIHEKEMEKIRIKLESELWDVRVQAKGKLATDKDIYQFG